MIVQLHASKWAPRDKGKVKQTIHVEYQGEADGWEELRKALVEAGYEIE